MNVDLVLREYFAGEKSEATLILLAGVLALAAAIWLWFCVREPFARGLAALGFTIDYYAEHRAVEYARGLEAAGAIAVR